MAVQQARVPVLDETGRFPDRYAPPSVVADADRAEQAAERAEVGQFIYDPRGNVSGTLDLSSITTQNFVHARLTGNLKVILPTSPHVGQTVTLVLRQDATGGRTLIVKSGPTAYSVPITLSTAANARDLIHLMWDGVDWNVLIGGLSMGVASGWTVA